MHKKSLPDIAEDWTEQKKGLESEHYLQIRINTLSNFGSKLLQALHEDLRV